MALKFYRLKISKLKNETDEALSISFDVPAQLEDTFKYRHGQYLTLKLPGDESVNRRAYSISSSFEFGEQMTVTVKRIEDGVVSAKICSNAKVGDEIEVMPPLGHFTIDYLPGEKRRFIMFGGGSGITPLISIIKGTLKNEPETEILLVFQNRNEDSVIFWDKIEQLKNDYPDNFRVIHILSRPDESWKGPRGRIDAARAEEFIRSFVPDGFRDAEYFICGPSGMMESVTDALDTLGIDKSKIHHELFTVELPDMEEAASHHEISSDEIITRDVKVRLYGEENTITVEPDESILQAAMSAGLEPPFSCQIGACSTCRAKLLSGKVHMDETEALTDEDIDEGFILTCQSHPLTDDVSVDYDF